MTNRTLRNEPSRPASVSGQANSWIARGLVALVAISAAIAIPPRADAGEAGPGRRYRRPVASSRAAVAQPLPTRAAKTPAVTVTTPTPAKQTAAPAGPGVQPAEKAAEPGPPQTLTADAREAEQVSTQAIRGGLQRLTTVAKLERIKTSSDRLIRVAGVEDHPSVSRATHTHEAAYNSDRVTSTVRAVQRGRACVVNIHSEKRSKSRDAIFNGSSDRKVNGMGTGIVVDERGYIVTNYHVVQDVDSLRVTLYDGSAYQARVVSIERRTDLAIIHIPTTRPLRVMPLGTSSDLMLGEDVLAIGNAFGYEHSVTRGIISAIGRDVDVNEEQAYKNLIQIDAAINPGNSGGPLLNRDGEVIGINVAIRAGAQRIGFAIPIDDARVTIAKLLSVESLTGVYHGVVTRDVKQSRRRSLVISRVEPRSPAATAGLKAGDIISKVGSMPTIDGADFERALLGRGVASTVPVEIVRDGVEQTCTMSMRTRSGRPARAIIPPQTAAVAAPARDVVWDKIGIRVRPVDPVQLTSLGSTYRGGMVVTEVRRGSIAEENSVQVGDVLVGLHLWETVTRDNLEYVLRHPDLESFAPLKFYIWRTGETLYGHFRISDENA